MKHLLISLFVLVSSVSSFADGVCEKKAISEAKVQASGGTLYDIESLATSKSYLVSYRVEIRDSDLSDRSQEVFDIILMRSSCSIVSLIRRL
jgi:hypothetical protein